MDKHELPYYWQLEVISDVLQKGVLGFPQRSCKIASRLVHEVVKLEQVAGSVVFDEGFRPETHYWNYDGERGLYIDLSLHQYNARLFEPVTPITIVSADYQWLRKSPGGVVEEADVRALVADVKQAITQSGRE